MMRSALAQGGALHHAPGLDALRALAVLAVLFAHGGWFLFAAWPAYDAYALSGWIGTELFFALSGFLVTQQLLAQRPSGVGAALHLVAWRAWRMLPLFWLALVAHLALALYAGRDLPEQAWRYPLLLQSLTTPHPAFAGEAWNLPVLFGFTLAAPGLWLAARQWGEASRSFGVWVGVLLLVGIALRAAWVAEHDPRWDEGVRKLVVTRVDACLYGALMAVLRDRVRTYPAALIGAVALIVAASGFLWLPRDADTFARVGLFVLSGAGSALLVGAAWQGGAALHGRLTTRLAALAWPLYLVNMPLLFGLDALGLGQVSEASAAVLRFALWLGTCLAGAVLLQRWIERPWLVLRRRVLTSSGAAASTSR